MRVDNRFVTKGKLSVIKGSILTPHNAGLRFVLNIDNLAGKPEGAWYGVFNKKWGKVREETRGWWATKTGAFKIGAVKTTPVQSDVWAVHMLCQDEKFKTSVEGLEVCLKEVCKMAKYERASVHISSLLTDAVPELKDLAVKHFIDNGVSVSFYEEPK